MINDHILFTASALTLKFCSGNNYLLSILRIDKWYKVENIKLIIITQFTYHYNNNINNTEFMFMPISVFVDGKLSLFVV